LSIVTKTGDSGSTALMYNRRVPKSHPQVEAYGAVDELNAALGLARATATDDFIRNHLLAIQKDLVILMGELATAAEDLPRYQKDGYSLVTPDLTAKLEVLVKEIEAQKITYQGWATPGGTLNSAALDVARTTWPPRRTPRLRPPGLRPASKPRNHHLPQPPLRPPLAFCPMGRKRRIAEALTTAD